jgi:very-short-patch-repair endonuclease
MRKALTPPEARMWVCLKRLRAEGFHFRRQAPFRGYFLDFVCNSRRLVIEVDGASHDARWEHDEVRDAVLSREGFKTVRFSNASVRDNLDAVMERVRAELVANIPTRASLRLAVPPHEGVGEEH